MALLPLENAPAVIESPMHMILMGVTADAGEDEEEENGINRRSRDRQLYIVFCIQNWMILNIIIIIISCYTIVLVNCLVEFCSINQKDLYL